MEEKNKEQPKKGLGFWDFCDAHPIGVTIVAVAACRMIGDIFGRRGRKD